MKWHAWLVLAATATGCASNEPQDVLIGGGVRVRSSVELNFELVQQNIATSQAILVERGLVPEARVGSLLDGFTIIIDVERVWDCVQVSEPGETCRMQCHRGRYDATDRTIRLGNNMAGLVHETLHHWETIHGGALTYFHPFWESNGYYAADRAMAELAEQVLVEPFDVVNPPACAP